MRKFVLILAVILLLPLTSFAKEQVVIIKKDCYSRTNSGVICKGLVKNLGNTDLKNVMIQITPSTGKDFKQKVIEFLAVVAVQTNTEPFDIDIEDIANSVETPAYDKIDYLPSQDTVPFTITWPEGSPVNPDSALSEILTVLKRGLVAMFITASLENNTIKTEITY